MCTYFLLRYLFSQFDPCITRVRVKKGDLLTYICTNDIDLGLSRHQPNRQSHSSIFTSHSVMRLVLTCGFMGFFLLLMAEDIRKLENTLYIQAIICVGTHRTIVDRHASLPFSYYFKFESTRG